MSEELKPCPFCGGNDLVIRSIFADDEPDVEIAKAVHCRDCCATGRHSNRIGWAESEREAIEAWNTRHIPEGFALVPVDANADMTSAGMHVQCNERGNAASIYKAMIAAAQTHPE